MGKKTTTTIEADKKEYKVHLPKLIDVVMLAEHPSNSNKQSKHIYAELKESIMLHGFDEPLLVVPRTDKNPGFWVVSGNHRFRAGKEIGYQQLPCIIREDWNDVEQEIQLVRRNYVRGTIDRTAFTEAVNRLSKQQNLALDDIMERMGFDGAESFAEFYKEEKKREKAMAASIAAQSNATQVKLLDDIQVVVSTLIEKYGTTIPQSFFIFPLGGRNHCFVAMTPALKQVIDAVSTHCVATGLNVNTVLGGLLQVGIHQVKFFQTTEGHGQVVEEGNKEGDTNPKLLK